MRLCEGGGRGCPGSTDAHNTTTPHTTPHTDARLALRTAIDSRRYVAFSRAGTGRRRGSARVLIQTGSGRLHATNTDRARKVRKFLFADRDDISIFSQPAVEGQAGQELAVV